MEISRGSVVVLALTALVLSACTVVSVVGQEQEDERSPFSLQDVLSGTYSTRAFNGTWISDTAFTFRSMETGVMVFDLTTLTASELIPQQLLLTLNTSSPVLSPDGLFLLAPSEVQSVYRYSTLAKYALYEIATGNITYIANHQLLQLCVFGGGHALAYVLDNDLYYLPEGVAGVEGVDSPPVQITQDGEPGVVYNGHTDWVYEEDVMYSGQAAWFSPDGSLLAFASFNDTDVETYSYYFYADKEDADDLYPELFHLKYPKVGRANPTVSLRVLNVTAPQQPTWVTLEAPDAVTADHVLAGVTWVTPTELAVHWLNRRQNYSVLRICDLTADTCEEEHRSQPDGWVGLSLPTFSAAGDFYMSLRWSLEQNDGKAWQHLYQHLRVNGQVVSSSVTPGAFSVNSFLGMDEANVAYYYTRTEEGAPWRSQVWVTGARSGCISCALSLPEGGACSWASATLSTGGTYMSVTCSSSDEPPAVFLLRPWTGEVLATWEDNAAVRDQLATKIRPQTFITTVALQSGHEAPVRLWLPPGLDLNDTETKYPVVFYVYSGPNTNNVYDSFTVGYQAYLTTSRDVIYMMADGRGAGLHSRDVLYSINNQLGSVEMDDHIEIMSAVLQRYQWMDGSRVGVWGTSYGGYATLLTLIKDEADVFTCGAAGALVTSWLYYNTMYTERYMGLPTEEDNLAGYEAGDINLLAESLRDKQFLIYHGNADDNVHYQHAAQLMKELQTKDIAFEQMSYPDEAHSLAGVSSHRYNLMDRFWEKCLSI